uniref:Uncharacterized protein n=1 Tax=Rhizophora mucronata TaxID=61149 RepID=A0A2P2Q7U2_RHIMU
MLFLLLNKQLLRWTLKWPLFYIKSGCI